MATPGQMSGESWMLPGNVGVTTVWGTLDVQVKPPNTNLTEESGCDGKDEDISEKTRPAKMLFSLKNSWRDFATLKSQRIKCGKLIMILWNTYLVFVQFPNIQLPKSSESQCLELCLFCMLLRWLTAGGSWIPSRRGLVARAVGTISSITSLRMQQDWAQGASNSWTQGGSCRAAHLGRARKLLTSSCSTLP